MFRSMKQKRPISEIGKRVLHGGGGGEKGHENDDDDDSEDGRAAAIIQQRRLRQKAQRKRSSRVPSRPSSTMMEADDLEEEKLEEEKEEEAEEDHLHWSSVTKTTFVPKRNERHRKRGIGFGGITIDRDDVTENDNVDGDAQSQVHMDDHDHDDDDDTQNLYSRDRLSKLLHEQQHHQQLLRPDDTDEHTQSERPQPSVHHTIAINHSSSYQIGINTSEAAEDYIPFHSATTTGSHILSGDEALAFVEHENEPLDTSCYIDHVNNDETVAAPSQSSVPESLDTKYNDEWEMEVIRRAGVKDPTGTISSRDIPSSDNRDSINDNNVKGSPTALLHQLRAQVTVAMEQIQENVIEMERQNQRRTTEMETNQRLLRQHETTLTTVTAALEFYNQWRNQYLIWMGAISELQEKIDAIMLSWHQLEQHVAAMAQWQQFYDQDIIAVLNEYEMVDQIIGTTEHVNELRRNHSKLTNDEPAVDEFGRSIVSQSIIQREKRRVRRRRICEKRHKNRNIDRKEESDDCDFLQYTLRGDESDGFISDDESETYRVRYEALQGALMIAVNEIHEDYITLQKLMAFFIEWYGKYPDEYQSSRAGNSFIHLALVLIRVEWCQWHDPWNESNGNPEPKWISEMQRAMNQKFIDIVHMEQLFTKCIIPTISDSLLNHGLNVQSSRQTESLTSFLVRLQTLLPTTNSIWMTLWNVMKSYLAQSLDNITIVTMREDKMIQFKAESFSTTDVNTKRSDEIIEAIYSASWGQMYRIQKIVNNIFQYWVPLLQSEPDFRTMILQFISNKFVRLILSVRMIKRFQRVDKYRSFESPRDVFQKIYEVLLRTKWLDLPEYTETNTTIQATALVFQMESD